MKIPTLLYDRSDAIHFLKHRPESDEVIPLTPNAKAVVVDRGCKIKKNKSILSDCQQAKVIARVNNVDKLLRPFFEADNEINQATRLTIQSIAHVLASNASICWEIARTSTPCFVRQHKAWKELKTKKDVQLYLIGRFKSDIDELFNTTGRPLFPLFLQWLNRIQTRLLADKTNFVFNSFDYGSKDIWEKVRLKTDDTYAVVVNSVSSGLKGFIKGLIVIVTNLMPKSRMFTLLAIPFNNMPPSNLANHISSIKDPVVGSIFKLYEKKIAQTEVHLRTLSQNMSNCIKQFKPKAIISNQIRWHHSAVLGEIAEKYGIENHLISHGSHTLPDTKIASVEQFENAKGLLITELSTTNYFQSPQAAKFAKRYNTKGHHCKPIMWGYKTKVKSEPSNEERIILHAGTYKTLGLPRPWMYETSSEFVEGLIILIRATATIPNSKLVIRIRLAPECSLDSLLKLLPKAEHFCIKTEGTFLDDLSRAQLLVSFSSTTIEEALNARKPVLLWGGTNRYLHLSASQSAPTQSDRSPVYTPKTTKDLGSMVSSILDVHTDSPLTDEELKGYVWPPSTPGFDLLAANLNVL